MSANRRAPRCPAPGYADTAPATPHAAAMRVRLARMAARGLAWAALCAGAAAPAGAETFILGVQPILPAKQTHAAFTPLARYLSEQTGHTIELAAAPNFMSYWQEMKKGRYDLALDAAHLTDYRVQKMNYRVIAKIFDVVSFTLVTGEDLFVFEPAELVGKRVASLAAPSRGALTLNSFFANPMRRPAMIEVTNAQEAIAKVLGNQVHGAIIPTPLIGANPQLNVVQTQEQWPHIGFSVSPKVSAVAAESLRVALTGAADTEQGRRMLRQINLPGFEAADAQTYAGYADILQGFWGY